MKKTKFFDSIDELSLDACNLICRLIKKKLKNSAQFSIVLSGGKSPVKLYKLLARQKLDWKKIHLFIGDERFVSLNHKESNYRMIKKNLIDNIDIPVLNFHYCDTFLEIDDASKKYRNEIADFFNGSDEPSFDIILLGIGKDGHTASLFPKDPTIDTDRFWVKPVPAPDIIPKVERITLTLKIINKAHNILFITSTKGKKEIVNNILEGNEKKVPAAKVFPVNGNLYLYVNYGV